MKKNEIEFDEEFKKYCKDIADNNKITITDENKWYITIKMKGWNQYKKIYELYKKYSKNKTQVKSDDLIDLYKINIRVRNTLYECSLFLEEYIKSLFDYWKKDENEKLNIFMIGKLIKKIKSLNLETKILKEINGQDFVIPESKKTEDYYESWKDIRNISCHRGLNVILEIKNLKSHIENMFCLLSNNINYQGSINNCCRLGFRDQFIKQFNKALSIKTEDKTIIKIIDNFTIKKKTN